KDALAQTIAGREAVITPHEVLAIAERPPRADYLRTIQSLPPADAHTLTLWLNGRVLEAERTLGKASDA
ncbi:MAG: hypothetical protein FWH21_08200, partial [Kiritimatiellaeota bacterium]|nr:hypothetical protein [Kiritimatiellota bacterium]